MPLELVEGAVDEFEIHARGLLLAVQGGYVALQPVVVDVQARARHLRRAFVDGGGVAPRQELRVAVGGLAIRQFGDGRGDASGGGHPLDAVAAAPVDT